MFLELSAAVPNIDTKICGSRTGELSEALTLCDELPAEAKLLDQQRGGATAFTRKGVILLALESYNEALALKTFEAVKAIKSDIGECGTDYGDSLARMRATSHSPQLLKLLDQEYTV